MMIVGGLVAMHMGMRAMTASSSNGTIPT